MMIPVTIKVQLLGQAIDLRVHVKPQDVFHRTPVKAMRHWEEYTLTKTRGMGGKDVCNCLVNMSTAIAIKIPRSSEISPECLFSSSFNRRNMTHFTF